MDIDGIKVMVTGDPYPGEIEGYVRRGLREHGKRLTEWCNTLTNLYSSVLMKMLEKE